MPRYVRLTKRGRKTIETDCTTDMSFKEEDGTHHPRNVLWHWSDEELKDRLGILVIPDEPN